MIQGEMPIEDSENLTDEEIATALPTVGLEDFANCLTESAKVEGIPHSHELLRRTPNLYCRTVFASKVLLFQVNWLQ